jgi:hypothetical protein
MAAEKDPQFTVGEIAKMTWLVGRMAKRGIAGPDVSLRDLQKKFDRIVEGARDREDRAAADNRDKRK